MSISQELTALNTNLTAAKDAVTTKGGTVGDTGLAGLAAEIATIPSGGGDYNAEVATTLTSATAATVPEGLLKNLPSIEIGGSVTRLASVFQSNTSLESVTLTGGSSGLYVFNRAFYYCTSLTSVDLSGLTVSSSISLKEAFRNCNALTSLSLPTITAVSALEDAFSSCYVLPTLDCSGWDTSSCSSFSSTFMDCRAATTINMSGWTNPNSVSTSSMFLRCFALTSLVIDSNEVFNLTVDSLIGTPIASGTGYIYVPDNLVASYQAASYWSTYSSQIKGMSEYTG